MKVNVAPPLNFRLWKKSSNIFIDGLQEMSEQNLKIILTDFEIVQGRETKTFPLLLTQLP